MCSDLSASSSLAKEKDADKVDFSTLIRFFDKKYYGAGEDSMEATVERFFASRNNIVWSSRPSSSADEEEKFLTNELVSKYIQQGSVKQMQKEQHSGSSTKARSACKDGNAEVLRELLVDGVRTYVKDNELYA